MMGVTVIQSNIDQAKTLSRVIDDAIWKLMLEALSTHYLLVVYQTFMNHKIRYDEMEPSEIKAT